MLAYTPLALLEARLRPLLPPDLHAAVWVDPSPPNLTRVFEHLRTLQRVLHNYLPRSVSEDPPAPGEVRYAWREGTLVFTDLAGFTSLLESNALYGRAGAEALLGLLNSYFAQMIEIISKAGGDLLEFTGDAILAQFPADERQGDVGRAVRASLRMQRAMQRFFACATPHGTLSFGMRVGVHRGRYLSADIGTPGRMEHVLLGTAVERTKQAESVGQVGRVCISAESYTYLAGQFRVEPQASGHLLVVDDLSADELGEYDVGRVRHRGGTALLVDRSMQGLLTEIEGALRLIEPLASYLPAPILGLLVASAARRQIPPTFPELTVAFVNLLGISEAVDELPAGAEAELVRGFSQLFSRIASTVDDQGGVLKNVTYHLLGPDMLIYFGTPLPYGNETARAAAAALAIRHLVATAPLCAGEFSGHLSCQIGIAQGPAFAAEIGEPRGRREFNILGDTVNTAARLMSRAAPGQILITEPVRQALGPHSSCRPLGDVPLKGKATTTPIYALDG